MFNVLKWHTNTKLSCVKISIGSTGLISENDKPLHEIDVSTHLSIFTIGGNAHPLIFLCCKIWPKVQKKESWLRPDTCGQHSSSALCNDSPWTAHKISPWLFLICKIKGVASKISIYHSIPMDDQQLPEYLL